MKTRTGKIARLPAQIRDELNTRITDGAQGKDILAWLNALPEVQFLLHQHFEGRPISEVNLTEWRQGGYSDWLMLQTCFDGARILSEGADQIAGTGIQLQHLLTVITAIYASLIQQWGRMPEADLDRKLLALNTLTKAILSLRSSELKAARLELDRERMELRYGKATAKSPSSASSHESSSPENPPGKANPGSPHSGSSAVSTPFEMPIAPPPSNPESEPEPDPAPSDSEVQPSASRQISHRPFAPGDDPHLTLSVPLRTIVNAPVTPPHPINPFASIRPQRSILTGPICVVLETRAA